MRTFFLLLFVIGAGVFIFRDHKWFPSENKDGKKPVTVAAHAPNAAPATPAPAAAPAEVLSEDAYITFGMPPLSSAWDAATLKTVSAALHNINIKRPRAMPGPDTEYGRAFFAKLRYTVGRSHLLSPENKVASYNAFRGIMAEFGGGSTKERPRDREVALLIGLQCELIVGMIEDPEFVKDAQAVKTRTLKDMNGNVTIYTPSYVHFMDSAATMSGDIAANITAIGNGSNYRPEARALALSHLSLHLPKIAQRLDMKNIRPILVQNRNNEPDPTLRAQYDSLILRMP